MLGYVGAVETLLECEVDITSKTYMGETTLRTVAESHHSVVVKLLLEKGAPQTSLFQFSEIYVGPEAFGSRTPRQSNARG